MSLRGNEVVKQFGRSHILFMLGVLHFLMVTSSYADDGELWTSATFKAWQSEDKATRVSLYAESRFRDDAGELYGAFIGPIVRHKVNSNLQVGGAYKFINFRNGDRTFDPRSRWELEVTPGFSFGDTNQYRFSLRNRFELFKNTGLDDKRRLRHRLMLSGKLADTKLVTGWFINHELIYDLESGHTDLSQYRFIPIGLKMKPTETFNLNVFYMLYRRSSNGAYNHTVGLSFTF